MDATSRNVSDLIVKTEAGKFYFFFDKLINVPLSGSAKHMRPVVRLCVYVYVCVSVSVCACL